MATNMREINSIIYNLRKKLGDSAEIGTILHSQAKIELFETMSGIDLSTLSFYKDGMQVVVTRESIYLKNIHDNQIRFILKYNNWEHLKSILKSK